MSDVDKLVARAEERWNKHEQKASTAPSYPDLDEVEQSIISQRYSGKNVVGNETVLALTKELRKLRQADHKFTSEVKEWREVNNLLSAMRAIGVVGLTEEKYRPFDNTAPTTLLKQQIEVIEKILVQRLPTPKSRL